MTSPPEVPQFHHEWYTVLDVTWIPTPMPMARLRRMRPDEFYVITEGRREWVAMPPSWSAEASPGDFVQRKQDSAMDRRPGTRPEGMVVANLFNCEPVEDGPDRVLVLFFR